MKDIMGMMKQVGEMKARLEHMQTELSDMEITGQSGAGLVTVTLNGKGEMPQRQNRPKPRPKPTRSRSSKI